MNKLKSVKTRIAQIGLFAFLFIILSFIPVQSFAGSWNGWIYQDPYPTSVNLFDVKFVTPLKGWITGKYGTILYTADGGENWESQESGTEEDLLRVSFVNEKLGWAAGDRGTIIHTQDGGKNWVTQFNIKALPTKIFFINEKEGWVSGSSPMGIVYSTKDSGKTWQKLETGVDRAIGSIYFFNSQTGWILAGEDVYRTTDGGNKWEKSKLPIGKSLLNSGRPLNPGGGFSTDEGLGYEWWYGDIAFPNKKQGWAVVNQWNVFHTADGGKTWNIQVDTGLNSYGFSHISFRGAKNGCVSGSTVYCTEDGGKIWQERLGVRQGGSWSLGGVHLIGQSSGWTVGNDGHILKTEDNGQSWKDPSTWNKCGSKPFFVNKNTGWVYSPRGFNMLCKTDDSGYTWEKQDIGMKVMNIFFADKSTGWAVGLIEEWKGGKESSYGPDCINVWGVIKNTTDGGKTWSTQYQESMGKEGFPGLMGISFVNPKVGWVVGKNGNILHTKDGGMHWQRQQSGDTLNTLRQVHFINSQIGWISGYQVTDYWTGIILHTEDGGLHWTMQHKERDAMFDDLHFIDKKSGWVSGQTEYGEVGLLVQTEDGGKTWREKEFEAIGYNHMAFADKKKGVIYSIQNGAMNITTDGGKTWNKMRVPLKKYPWHFSEIFENDMP